MEQGTKVRYPAIDTDSDAFSLFEAPNMTGTPERRLILAIIERAILDYVGNEDDEAQAAEEWLFGELENPSYIPFSFPWICRELDLNINTVVEKVKSMPKRGKFRVAPWYFTKRLGLLNNKGSP